MFSSSRMRSGGHKLDPMGRIDVENVDEDDERPRLWAGIRVQRS